MHTTSITDKTGREWVIHHDGSLDGGNVKLSFLAVEVEHVGGVHRIDGKPLVVCDIPGEVLVELVLNDLGSRLISFIEQGGLETLVKKLPR